MYFVSPQNCIISAGQSTSPFVVRSQSTMIPVLYRDSHLLICDKPVGVSSESPGLPDLIEDHLGFSVYPVHRLDRGTGGVVILALSSASCSALQKLFQANCIRKEYLAVIYGCPSETSGYFEDYLFHDKKKNKSFIVDRPRTGVKKAVCSWELCGSIFCKDGWYSLVRVLLHTGRTHQIRVQFASRGFPLIGDRRYGCKVKADHPALWAVNISFPHPFMKNSPVSARSMPPHSFPWDLFRYPGEATTAASPFVDGSVNLSPDF